MKTKTRRPYHLRNGSEYNSALVQRGSLTLWVDKDVLDAWHHHTCTGKRGRPRIYTDMAILCMATLEAIYNLPLRATEGWLASVVKWLRVDLPVPEYTTLCRRRKGLEVVLPRRAKTEPLHLVVDGTGVKVYGEGEWKVRQHGYSKRRTWRKLHIGVDEATGESVAAVGATNNFTDGQIFPELLDQVADTVGQVSGDGAYEKRHGHHAINGRGRRFRRRGGHGSGSTAIAKGSA